MTIHEAQQQLILQLSAIYDNREAMNIADWVIEHVTGKKKIDRITGKNLSLSKENNELLQKYTGELLAHKPVQYVLHSAWFYGFHFYVDENVLIPRPETEELVEWVVGEIRSTKYEVRNTKILDVGTGSGCIPVALKKKLPEVEVYSCDVSKEALTVAKKNAATHQANIHFLHLDFLDTAVHSTLPDVDIIISNPPYVPQQDKATISKNVLQYEPHLALFVENNDPLVFYKAIADFALTKLKPGGIIYAEIHEDLGDSVTQLFQSKGFHHVVVKRDMQGKERMVKVVREVTRHKIQGTGL